MSISITDYPVKVVGKNIFPGDSPLEITFQREDLQIISIEQGADNTIVINVGTDITGFVNVGEYIYLNSFTISVSAEVLEISATQIRIDYQWEFDNNEGYINYLQNYYLELEVVDPDNVNIKVLPFTLTNDGKDDGEIIMDLAIVNDLNPLVFPKFTGSFGLGGNTATKFNIRYRQQYRELNGGAYTFVNNPIIITPALTLGEPEEFTNAFSQPNYYAGYPNGAVYLHSDSNPSGSENINFYYDELDINKETIRNNIALTTYLASNYGKLFVLLYELSLLEDTEYISLRSENASLPEFSPEDFTDDFNIE